MRAGMATEFDMPAEPDNRPGDPGPYRAHLAHQSARRLRLRLEETAVRSIDAQGLADRLTSVQGVARVVFRPNTGSLIFETLVDAGEVLEALRQGPLLSIKAPPKPPPVGQMIQMGLLKADMDLGRRTEGALDLRTTIALLLLFGAILQLARGRVAGPATTLAMSAFALLDRSSSGARR